MDSAFVQSGSPDLFPYTLEDQRWLRSYVCKQETDTLRQDPIMFYLTNTAGEGCVLTLEQSKKSGTKHKVRLCILGSERLPSPS